MNARAESPHDGFVMDTSKDKEGRYYNNIVGRFDDHRIIDGKATAEAGGVRQYRTVTVCRLRVIFDASDQQATDETVIRVTDGNKHELAERFPEAWAEYCRRNRKTQPRKSKSAAPVVKLVANAGDNG